MVTFKAEIERFNDMGEKTGWTYVFIPFDLANQIKSDCRKSYRVKGRLDQVEIEGMSMVPMGEGNFIIPLNGAMRKKLRKERGAIVEVSLQEHADFKIDMPEDLEICLSDEAHLLQSFMKQPKSHRNYFINWLNTAKTEETRTKRIVKIVAAMDKGWDFGTMIREGKPRAESK